MKSIKKQQGVAGIIYIMMFPAMMMTLAFTMQLSQQFLAHARLSEASEVASLALIANPKEDNENNVSYARKVVDRYVLDNINDIKVTVKNKQCKYKDGCVQSSGEAAPFTDFTVDATAEHKSWISYEDISLKPEFTVNASSVTRKFLPQPVDVYFIVDMSASMRATWKNGKSQIDEVKEVITRVVNDLKDFDTEVKSRVALLGYHNFSIKQGERSLEAYDYALYSTPQQTVSNMFFPPKRVNHVDSGLFSHRDIDLTPNYSSFLQIMNDRNFYPPERSCTRSWQGIIAAAQAADKATDINPEQVFIILSDGADCSWQQQDRWGDWLTTKNYLKKLVDGGLCKKLKQRIRQKPNRFQSSSPTENEKTKVTMGVIGVNYQVNPNDGFGDCVGRDNIYHATQGDDVYKYILNLINEETGRLKD
ncbi:TadE/TadG family type IV pilus assembly protein [Vibrio cholerae]|uniref:TadE/TadG family type IV pilus assembly protein n=1 Tax=Vibrio cholerae TaxID=666 RepID=UPI00115923A6|nr:vWA domain-containing protein [Vibrio cholerae]TQP29477.1 pilus assembly protein TadG [Vibrio cholerae]TQQ72529.1 pilus assembly protein TadG [Vibrio cholerae]